MKTEYPKIDSVFLRDPISKHRTFLEGQYSNPLFEQYKDRQWSADEKIDGTNIRIVWDGRKVRFYGRTDNASLPTSLVHRLQDIFLDQPLEHPTHLVFYGEGCGKGIQDGSKYFRNDVEFVLFDVAVSAALSGDEVVYDWLSRTGVEYWAERFGIMCAPSLGTMTLQDAVEKCRAGFKSRFGDFESEGLVLRLKTGFGRLITKVKCKDFR